MKTIKQLLIKMTWCAALLIISFVVSAQNTVSISNTSGAVSMNFVAPAQAGNPLMEVTDKSNWLNYHITSNTMKYSISAQLQTALPTGVELKVLAGVYQGTWGGSAKAPNQRGSKYTDTSAGDSPGIPATVVTLSLLPQVIISNIGTFDTGSGPFLGHQLTYTMSISDYSKVRATSLNVSIIYTITQL